MARDNRSTAIAAILGLLMAGLGGAVAESRITFEQQKDALLIRADGRPLATYVYRDPETLRPYFKDLHAPGGIRATRRHPPREGADPVDHATRHPGLWLAFGDQEEMGLGVRVATPMMVKPFAGGGYRPGRILNDQGRREEEQTWGRQAAWCDYSGWVEGKFVGLMVMPDPANEQSCRWHTRDYGFMAANPFGHAVFKQGPPRKTEVKPGRPYRLRFGILIHSSDREDGISLDAAYQDYLQCAGGLRAKSLGLDPGAFRHHVDLFNRMEPENIVNHVSNAQSWEWMRENVPLFECPDKGFEQIYYFRWWTFRKHLKETSDGFVFTEFLDRVGHSGRHNTISCTLGHHICEGTWLHNSRYIDDYARFWYVGNEGDLQPHLHQYSHWGYGPSIGGIW